MGRIHTSGCTDRSIMTNYYDEESREGFLRAGKTITRYDDSQRLKKPILWTCTIAYALFSTSLCVALLAYITTHATAPMDRLPEELGQCPYLTSENLFTIVFS